MRKTKGFSYDPEKDMDVIGHIDNQPNGSQYVWELVRRDMRENNLDVIIQRHIEKYLKNIDKSLLTNDTGVEIDEDEIKNILQI